MAHPPKLPKMAPEDMAWVRWVTNEVRNHGNVVDKLGTRVSAVQQQRQATSQAAAQTGQQVAAVTPVVTPTVPTPTGLPQKPTPPQVSSDHATVTIRWDGYVYPNLTASSDTTSVAKVSPAVGFDHVSVQRTIAGSSTWITVGTALRRAGVTVDADVTVSQAYYYRLVTFDTLGRQSAPSNAVLHTPVGVDLGNLDGDLKQLITDLNHSATTGGLVSYSPTAPTDPKYHDDSAIWFDTSDPNGAIPNRWDSTQQRWVPIPWGSGALGEGSIVASKILAGAIDTAALGAGSVTAEKLSAGSVIAEKIGADAVTANKIAAGSIDANKLAVGAVQAKHIQLDAVAPSATPVNRVPRPLTDTTYWSQIIDGTINFQTIAPRFATAQTFGAVLTASTTQAANLPLTTYLPSPISQSLHVHIVTSGTVNIVVRQRSTTGALTDTIVSNDSVVALAANTTHYAVHISVPINNGSATITEASVFEVIGVANSAQSAQLSPAGLRLFNDAGELSVDLSTSSNNFLTIYNDGAALATVDEDGNGTFQNLQANDIIVGGARLLGDFPDFERMDGLLDGSYFSRIPRGIIYMADWATLNNFVVNTQYQRLASGAFTLDADRQYMFVTDLGALQTDNASGRNVYIELQMSLTPMAAVTDGTVVNRSVVYNGEGGYFVLAPVLLKALTGTTAIDPLNNTLPAERDIYWQINTNLSAAPTASYTFHQYSASNGFSIVDMGPVMTPLSATDRTTGGSPATGGAGTGTPGTSTNKTVTRTWNTTWSASWRESGATKVIGTGTYTDADRLYQGLGNTPMGAKFGFPDLTAALSGKTISKVEVYLQNRWTYYNAGGTAYMAGHANSSEPGTFGSIVSGTSFSSNFTRGQGKWVTISNTTIPFASWKSGAVRGIALTVRGGSDEYAYYDGYGKSSPPKLRITYS